MEGTDFWSLRAAGLAFVCGDVLPNLKRLLQFKDLLSTFSQHFIQVNVRLLKPEQLGSFSAGSLVFCNYFKLPPQKDVIKKNQIFSVPFSKLLFFP